MNAATLADRLSACLPLLMQGAAMTLAVSAAAILLGFALGAVLLGLSLRRSGRGLLPTTVRVYLSFFRGTPLLVQLLILFYLPGACGIDLPPLLVAVVGLGLNSAAFQCEILRAGLIAVSAGQIEAAASFGISPAQIFWHVQLPQLAWAVWPAVISEGIDVVKGSAIVSVISVADLARVGRQIVAVNFRPLEVYLSVGLCYLLMTGLVLLLGNWLRGRLECT